MSLKVRLVFLSSLVLMVIFALFAVYNYRQDVRAMERAEQEKVKLHLAAIQAEIDERFHVARTGVQLVANDEDVQAVFASRDRAGLERKLKPLYESIQDQVGQFHFHLPDTTSFLRMHQPEKYGDTLGDSRPGVLEANKTGMPVQSIEKGLGGLGCRVIVPVFYRDDHIGTLEMGARFDQDFLMGLQESYGSEYFIYSIDDQSNYIAGTLAEDPVAMPGDHLEQILAGYQVYGFADDRNNVVASLPLFNHSEEAIAYLKVVSDRSEVITAMFEKQVLMASSYLSAVVVAALLVMLALKKSILKPLDDLKNYLRRVANLDLSARLPVERKDELGEIAENFNHTVEVIRKALGDLETTHKQTLTVLDNISAVVYVTDISTHEILFINQNGKDIYGDVVGKTCWQALQKDQQGPCEFCAIEDVPTAELYTRNNISWELRSTYNQRHYEYRCGVIKWIDGRKARIAIATDSTDRKMAEEIILQSREWYRTLAEDIPALVCRMNPDFDITFVNDSYCYLMGKKRSEILYKNIFNLIPSENQAVLKDAFEGLNPFQPVSTHINTRISYDGSTRWIKWNNRALFDQDGSTKEYLCIGEDITEQKLHEAQLEYLSLHDPFDRCIQ